MTKQAAKTTDTKTKDTKPSLPQFLVKVIEAKGQSYLQTNAYDVYQMMLRVKIGSPLHARMTLLTLLSGIPTKALELSNDVPALSLAIQTDCCLNADMSNFLAEVYSQVFSNENQAKWKQNAFAGFKSFCRQTWEFEWIDLCEWERGHLDCTGSGSITVKISSQAKIKQELKAKLEANPFLTDEEIHDHFQALLAACLDADFEEYCSSDDYYPPVVEDYDDNFYDVVSKFCTKHGFELLESDYEGDLSDYEPDDRW